MTLERISGVISRIIPFFLFNQETLTEKTGVAILFGQETLIGKSISENKPIF